MTNNKNNTVAMPAADSFGRGRRECPRWYFYNPFTELEDQISGISGIIKTPGWWFDRLLTNTIIKDLSMGGAGFIVPQHTTVPDHIILELEGKYRLECEVLHRRPLNRYLTFYGVRWEHSRRRIVMTIISKYSRQSRFVR